MPLVPDKDDDWEEIVRKVDGDQIPLCCVKKILFKLEGGRQKTINLNKLRKEGLESEELEIVIARTMVDQQKQIINMNLIIDVDRVKNTIQPITDKLLGNL